VAFEDWITEARADAEIEQLAHRLRIAAGNGNDWAPDVADLIARLARPGSPLSNLKLIVRPDEEMPDDEAIAFVDDRRIEVRESVYRGAQQGRTRDRMTLAHELGHVALGHFGAPKSRKPGPGRRESFISPAKSAERQATVFAAAFLMLRASVRECQSADEVARRFKVSLEAARIRFNAIRHQEFGRPTPPDVEAAIRNLKTEVSAGYSRRVPDSVLSPELQMRLAWATADESLGDDPSEYRCVDKKWMIRWSRRNQSTPGGWRIAQGKVVPWDAECT
jgi:hypothetical protein